VKKDEKYDLALLEINNLKDTTNYYKINNSIKVRIGDEINVVGYPDYRQGDSSQVFSGHISGQTRDKYGNPRLTFDRGLFQGMSGGPAVNNSLEIIGVSVTGAENPTAALENFNNGLIPIDSIISFLNQNGKSN